jgi:NTE family protein
MYIGLALSGGGAIGAAHIGALEQMEEHCVRLDSICGISAGAIVGLLYADGGIDAIFRF